MVKEKSSLWDELFIWMDWRSGIDWSKLKSKSMWERR
jgi:hypothetical protein